MKETTAGLMVEVEQLRSDKNVLIEKCAQIAENWGGAPPNPTGRRAALAAEIRRLQDSNFCSETYDMDQRNIGSSITARKLQEIAETGTHLGIFGGKDEEQAAQSIIDLHREIEDADRQNARIWERIKEACQNYDAI